MPTTAFQPTPVDEVDEKEKERARKIALDVMKSWQDRRFEKLSEDFSERMRIVFDPENQEKSWNQMEELFGDFESLTFVEAATAPKLELTAYRFKGTFTKAEKDPEIRVVFDKMGKVNGFWIKHWRDKVR